MSTETKTFETIQHLQAALPSLPDGAVVHDRDGDRVSRVEVPGMMGVYAPYTVTYETADTTPVPLDPSKVKAGDTVTLERGKASVTDEVAAWDRRPHGHFSVTLVNDPAGPPYRVVGGITGTSWTLTDHQPAPEPELEWKPGATGTATVRTVPNIRVMRLDGVTQPWVSVVPFAPAGDVKGEGQNRHDDWQVTDFVPDEDHARLAVEQCRQLHQDGLTREEWHKRHCGAVQPLQDVGEFVAEIDTDIVHDGSYVDILRAEFGALRRQVEQAEADKDVWINRHNARVAWAVREKEEMTAGIEKVARERDEALAEVKRLENECANHHVTREFAEGLTRQLDVVNADLRDAQDAYEGAYRAAAPDLAMEDRTEPLAVVVERLRKVAEPGPLPTREQRAQVVDLLIAFSNDRADEWHTADKILALLRGETR